MSFFSDVAHPAEPSTRIPVYLPVRSYRGTEEPDLAEGIFVRARPSILVSGKCHKFDCFRTIGAVKLFRIRCVELQVRHYVTSHGLNTIQVIIECVFVGFVRISAFLPSIPKGILTYFCTSKHALKCMSCLIYDRLPVNLDSRGKVSDGHKKMFANILKRVE